MSIMSILFRVNFRLIIVCSRLRRVTKNHEKCKFKMNIILYVDLVVTNRRMRALRDVNIN